MSRLSHATPPRRTWRGRRFSDPWSYLSLHVFREQALDDDDVGPTPVALSVFFVNADFAKSESSTQRSTGGVGCEDARQHFHEASPARVVDQMRQQHRS